MGFHYPHQERSSESILRTFQLRQVSVYGFLDGKCEIALSEHQIDWQDLQQIERSLPPISPCARNVYWQRPHRQLYVVQTAVLE